MYRIIFKLESKKRCFMIWGHLGAAGTKMASKNEISEVFWARPNSRKNSKQAVITHTECISSLLALKFYLYSMLLSCNLLLTEFWLETWKFGLAQKTSQTTFFASWSPRRPQIGKGAFSHPHNIKFCTLYKFLGFFIANCFYPLSAPPA